MRRLAPLLLVLLVAGCSGDPSEGDGGGAPPPDARWATLALPYGEGHDHANVSHHAGLSTPNFSVVGWNPLVSPTAGGTPGGHFCGDAQDVDGGRRLAAVEQRTVGGFVLMDVTDPAAPQVLGELVVRGARVYDLAVTLDGLHVVLVTTEQVILPSLPAAAAPPATLSWRSACGDADLPLAGARDLPEDVVPRPSSIVLVDISDPAEPAIVDQRPLPGNGHSVFPTVVDGRQVLLVAALAQGNGYYQVHELVETPLGKRLRMLSTYGQDNGGSDPLRTSRWEAHDGWLAPHPVTGQTLVYLAGGRHFTVVDGTDLAQPREIGRWSDWSAGRDASTGHLHSVYPLPELWDGRHFTLLGPEFADHPGDQPSGTLWVLDTTDPTRPFAVGAWVLPVEVEWTDTYMFSNHYFTVHGETAFVSMYHGGVWAIDLAPVRNITRQEDLVQLDSVGVFMPENVSPAPPATMLRWTPTVQEVFAFPDGTLVLFDGSSGVYTVRYDATRPMPAPEPWVVPVPPGS